MEESWLGRSYRELPEPIVLKEEKDMGYMSGVKEDGWIRWVSRQRVEEGKFIHKDWFELPFGFEGTRNLIMKINMDLERGRRSHLKTWAAKKGILLEEANYEVFGHRLPFHDQPGIKVAPGGTPCLLWQVGLGGSWCLVSRYGIVEGLDVSVREDVEWQLRHGLMIGFVYFMGKGIKSFRDRSIRKLMKGKTTWDWSDVGLEIWGMGNTLSSAKGRYIRLAGEKWKVLPNYTGKLKVGNCQSVIVDNMHEGGKKAWEKFTEDTVNSGCHLGHQTKDGFRYHNGWGWDAITQERYNALYVKVRDFG